LRVEPTPRAAALAAAPTHPTRSRIRTAVRRSPAGKQVRCAARVPPATKPTRSARVDSVEAEAIDCVRFAVKLEALVVRGATAVRAALAVTAAIASPRTALAPAAANAPTAPARIAAPTVNPVARARVKAEPAAWEGVAVAGNARRAVDRISRAALTNNAIWD